MVGLISALIIIPLTGAFALYVGRPKNARAIALIFNALAAFLALILWRNFDSGAAGLQMVERHAWIPAIGAEYLVGVDGLSLLLVLLTSLIIPFAFLGRPTYSANAPASGTMISALIKPTMRRRAATPACRLPRHRDKFGFVPSAQRTSGGPDRACRQSSHRRRH
jgi:NADH:ubiquinone oxidoreductase subunit 4 (subunit M)